MVISLEEFAIALDQNDVSALLLAVKEGTAIFFEELLNSHRKYFHELCQWGHANVVEVILTRRSVYLEEEWEQQTPLQLAAANGHADLVSLLLYHGAELADDICCETSPFYIATIRGHLEVLKKLTDHRPSLLSKAEVHSHLLLVACSSGNLDTVKFWILPQTDVNAPPEVVSSLDKCEDLVPLWVACKGHHLEVAQFLMHMGATITRNICLLFPEFTSQLVIKCFNKSENNEFWTVSMTAMKLEVVHPVWFHEFLTTLTKVNLSNNELTSLPPCIPWSMTNITHLNLSKNKLDHFPGPDNNTDFTLVLRLKSVNLSNNRLDSVCIELFGLTSLEKLNLSHNNLSYLIKPTHFQGDWQKNMRSQRYSQSESDLLWLPNLTHLDISHNTLKLVPAEIRDCSCLQHLILNNNELFAFPSPWPCKLKYLDLSFNDLESQFLVSAEMFWSDSLEILKIHDNELDEIGESIVKLSELKELHAANNKIERLPADIASWDCRRLNTLDLAHNKLGVPLSDEESLKVLRKAPKTIANLMPWKMRTEEKKSSLDLPEFLGDSLQYLDLSYNNLDVIPDSVNHLFNIIDLNLSGNPLIKVLPKQMGLLKKCVVLNLEGTGIPDKVTKDQKPCDLIRELKMEWRQSKNSNEIKLIVLGPKEKGKTTLINLLRGEQLDTNCDKKDINIQQWKYSPNTLWKKNHPDVTFNICEIPGDKTVMQRCFMTPNALYVLVFDLRSGKKGVQQLSEWLCVIQTTVPHSYVMLVGTFLDKLSLKEGDDKLEERKEKLMEIDREINSQYIYTDEQGECPIILCFHSLSCINSDCISDLRKLIYEKAKMVRDLFYHKQFVVDRKIPNSYVLLQGKLEKKLKDLESSMLPPVLHEDELQEMFHSIPSDDIRILRDQDKAIQYLVETGKLLHFNDQMEDLNRIYFLKPVYLQELLNMVLSDRDDMPQNAEISISRIQQCFDKQKYPKEFFAQYIQILKKFEIALDMDEQKKLMVPSKLPKKRPMCLAGNRSESSKICRLYRLSYIPSGLWNKLVIRVLQATHRFSHSQWFLGGQSIKDKDRKFCREKSVYGFRIKETAVTYWSEGIQVLHKKGTIMIESVKCRSARSDKLGKGILITVHSTSENFSVMGIIVDELDDVLHEYFPGFQDFLQEMPAIYAVCPDCFDTIKDDSDAVIEVDHFHVRQCAAAAFTMTEIPCPKGHNVSLFKLVPEMLFRELPRKFLLDQSNIELEKCLGTGAGGSVYKGKYDGETVAFKVFHHTKDMIPQLTSTDSGSGTWSSQATDSQLTDNSVDSSPFYQNFAFGSIKNPFHSKDATETKALKAYRAFTEFRREISVMSKLRHPCIISFLGISIWNQLILSMEMAPEGSLRAVLNSKAENQTFNKYRDKEKVFKPVLDKEITYKIVYQVAKGLQYLHDHSVIYRDMKSDNILVCSLDVADVVNAKLTDYGISKFSTAQGLVGFKGTMGYMAPEIMCNHTYNEKVDIFSFSMVMNEILTGRLPYEKCVNLSQLHQAIIKEKQRPSVQDYNIVSHFPYLEHLMSDCWNYEASKRPSAETIASRMHNISFLCEHEVIRPANNEKHFGEITCIASAAEDSSTKKNFLWFWENGQMTNERTYSIFDLEMSRFHVFQNICRGSEATCMAKVGRDMWIGTKASEVEVFSCQNVGVPKCMERLKQDGSPTAILHVENVDFTRVDNPRLGSVFLGLNNGMLVIYKHVPKSFRKIKDQWEKSSTTTLCQDKCVTSMTHIEVKNEIWVACGEQIFIFCTITLTMKHSIDIFKDSLTQKRMGKHRIVKDIAGAGSKVWCSFKNSSKLVEFDAELTEMMYIINVKDDVVECLYLGKENEDEQKDKVEDSSEESSEEDDPNGLNQTWPRTRISRSEDLRDFRQTNRSCVVSDWYTLPVSSSVIPERLSENYLEILPTTDLNLHSSSTVDSDTTIKKVNLARTNEMVNSKGSSECFHLDNSDDDTYEPVVVGAQMTKQQNIKTQIVINSKPSEHGFSKNATVSDLASEKHKYRLHKATPIPSKRTVTSECNTSTISVSELVFNIESDSKSDVSSISQRLNPKSDVSPLDMPSGSKSDGVPSIPPRPKPRSDVLNMPSGSKSDGVPSIPPRLKPRSDVSPLDMLSGNKSDGVPSIPPRLKPRSDISSLNMPSGSKSHGFPSIPPRLNPKSDVSPLDMPSGSKSDGVPPIPPRLKPKQHLASVNIPPSILPRNKSTSTDSAIPPKEPNKSDNDILKSLLPVTSKSVSDLPSSTVNQTASKKALTLPECFKQNEAMKPKIGNSRFWTDLSKDDCDDPFVKKSQTTIETEFPATVKHRPTKRILPRFSDSDVPKINNSDLPPVPPRTRAATGVNPRNPNKMEGDTNTGDQSEDRNAQTSHQRKKTKTKNNILSLLVVEDTLWLSTTSGSLKVLSQDTSSVGGCNLKLCELECVTSDEKRQVTGPQPITQMIRAKDLVVSMRKLTGDPVSHLSQLTSWDAYSSSRINVIESYWSKLAEYEKTFTRTDSFA